MSRKYEKVQKLLPEVKRLNAEGYTHRQIAEKLGNTLHIAELFIKYVRERSA